MQKGLNVLQKNKVYFLDDINREEDIFLVEMLEECIELDFIKILRKILGKEKETDIIKRRYNFYPYKFDKNTLEEVGAVYNVTRERIRQIEVDSLKKLRRFFLRNKHYIEDYYIFKKKNKKSNKNLEKKKAKEILKNKPIYISKTLFTGDNHMIITDPIELIRNKIIKAKNNYDNNPLQALSICKEAIDMQNRDNTIFSLKEEKDLYELVIKLLNHTGKLNELSSYYSRLQTLESQLVPEDEYNKLINDFDEAKKNNAVQEILKTANKILSKFSGKVSEEREKEIAEVYSDLIDNYWKQERYDEMVISIDEYLVNFDNNKSTFEDMIELVLEEKLPIIVNIFNNLLNEEKYKRIIQFGELIHGKIELEEELKNEEKESFYINYGDYFEKIEKDIESAIFYYREATNYSNDNSYVIKKIFELKKSKVVEQYNENMPPMSMKDLLKEVDNLIEESKKYKNSNIEEIIDIKFEMLKNLNKIEELTQLLIEYPINPKDESKNKSIEKERNLVGEPLESIKEEEEGKMNIRENEGIYNFYFLKELPNVIENSIIDDNFLRENKLLIEEYKEKKNFVFFKIALKKMNGIMQSEKTIKNSLKEDIAFLFGKIIEKSIENFDGLEDLITKYSDESKKILIEKKREEISGIEGIEFDSDLIYKNQNIFFKKSFRIIEPESEEIEIINEKLNDVYNSYLKSEPFSTFVKGLERLEESIINLSELDFLVENVQKTLFLIDETFIKSYEELDLKFDSLIKFNSDSIYEKVSNFYKHHYYILDSKEEWVKLLNQRLKVLFDSYSKRADFNFFLKSLYNLKNEVKESGKLEKLLIYINQVSEEIENYTIKNFNMLDSYCNKLKSGNFEKIKEKEDVQDLLNQERASEDKIKMNIKYDFLFNKINLKNEPNLFNIRNVNECSGKIIKEFEDQKNFSFFKTQLFDLRELLFKTRNNISLGNEIGILLKEIDENNIDTFSEFSEFIGFKMKPNKTSKGENKVADILDEMFGKIKAEYEVKINELIDNSGEEKVREGLLLGLLGMAEIQYGRSGINILYPQIEKINDLEELKKVRELIIKETRMENVEKYIEVLTRN